MAFAPQKAQAMRADAQALALTKTALDCARQLGLTPTDTATVLGVPQGVLAAMKKGDRSVDGQSGEAERADALVRCVQRLRLLLGEEPTHWRAWLRRDSAGLEAKPLDLFQQRDGILRVARFLQSAQSL